jgi:hypothetical protein
VPGDRGAVGLRAGVGPCESLGPGATMGMHYPIEECMKRGGRAPQYRLEYSAAFKRFLGPAK